MRCRQACWLCLRLAVANPCRRAPLHPCAAAATQLLHSNSTLLVLTSSIHQVQVSATVSHLSVGLGWYGRVLDGELGGTIRPGEVHWCLEEQEVGGGAGMGRMGARATGWPGRQGSRGREAGGQRAHWMESSALQSFAHVQMQLSIQQCLICQ